MKPQNISRIFQLEESRSGIARVRGRSGGGKLARHSKKLLCTTIAGFSWVAVSSDSKGQSVPLGEAQNYTVVSYAGVTNAGPSIITGDIGLSPLTTISGFGPGQEMRNDSLQ